MNQPNISDRGEQAQTHNVLLIKYDGRVLYLDTTTVVICVMLHLITIIVIQVEFLEES